MYIRGYQGHGIEDMAQIYRQCLAFSTSRAWYDNQRKE